MAYVPKITQVGFASKAYAALREFQQHAEFQRLVLRYTQAQFIQSAQTAGCNGRHSVQQRLARWLLLFADRLPADTPLNRGA